MTTLNINLALPELMFEIGKLIALCKTREQQEAVFKSLRAQLNTWDAIKPNESILSERDEIDKQLKIIATEDVLSRKMHGEIRRAFNAGMKAGLFGNNEKTEIQTSDALKKHTP